jgi:uracil-DNA glycosylase
MNTRFPEHLPQGWQSLLGAEKNQDYFKGLARFIASEYSSGQQIFPARENIFRALQAIDYPHVKVVILGQDPYHGEGQAIGLSFGVPNTLKPKPPSLENIFKELRSDLGVETRPGESDLTGWAKQGVLLLNTVLTVRAHQAFSHRDQGWEKLTDQIIQKLSERDQPLVFLLWGAAAQKKKSLIDTKKHRVIESAHPSPLSSYRGFFGSKPFSRINSILKEWGEAPIQWERVSDTTS